MRSHEPCLISHFRLLSEDNHLIEFDLSFNMLNLQGAEDISNVSIAIIDDSLIIRDLRIIEP
jgi:hypothetical protein